MRSVALRNENISVRCDRDSIWLEESFRSVATPWNPKRHQYFALGAEFIDLHASAILGRVVSHPNVARIVHCQSMWHLKQTTTEMSQHSSIG